jgi:nucleoside-diphosphate-sugar epimerase
MNTILGAGGVIANGLADLLIKDGIAVRWVSRNPPSYAGVEAYPADITDPAQALKAIQHSTKVFLCVGLKYDFRVWRIQWPKIMNNTIEACKASGARLIFVDNVYMYGKVDGMMTEDTVYRPSSRKGDLRARIATSLMSEVRNDRLQAIIARCADFYGPEADKTGILNRLVFENLSKQKSAQWLVNADTQHSFTYTPDAVKAIYLLSKSTDAWNQVWHLPTSPNPLTGKEVIKLAAEALEARNRYTILRPWMIKIAGLFNRTIAELAEMNYQYQFDYLFDSSKFDKAFNFTPTTYREGILATAAAYGSRNS